RSTASSPRALIPPICRRLKPCWESDIHVMLALWSGHPSTALQCTTDHTRRGGAWAPARRFFRNPYSLVGRERPWCSDVDQTKALLIDAEDTAIIPLTVAPHQPQLVGPVSL